MKYHFFTFLIAVSSIFVACNKEEDIVVVGPEMPENPAPENPEPGQPEISLNYNIIEYMPAPGQYINESVSGFEEITTMDDACAQAKKRLEKNLYVSLGAWGGYIIVKFDKPVFNSGEYDFAIAGNSFDTSNEPGIVWVMQDSNGNGLPDEEWFELKGSFFGQEGYERNYWVTYSRPVAKEATPWEDSNGETGFVYWMGSYHDQDYYYPNWVKEDSYTLYGSRLPLQAYQNPVTGVWGNDPFEWGYVDNQGSDMIEEGGIKNYFRISDAVTADNEPANLKYVNFIKVQTAINGRADLLGENSTEVTGFYRLTE